MYVAADEAPWQARQDNSDAWCASKTDNKQWLQIELGKVINIYSVVTQGKNGSNAWVTKYIIGYKHNNSEEEFMNTTVST